MKMREPSFPSDAPTPVFELPLPSSGRQFVSWVRNADLETVLVGGVLHDIRNIKTIARKYGYEWVEQTNANNIRSLAFYLRRFFYEESSARRALPGSFKADVPEPSRIPIPTERLSPQRDTTWGSW